MLVILVLLSRFTASVSLCLLFHVLYFSLDVELYIFLINIIIIICVVVQFEQYNAVTTEMYQQQNLHTCAQA